MPKVSVVIPVKDCARTIERSISSVLEQTYEDFEVIVVDNLCEDETIPRIKAFKDTRIKIIQCNTPGIVPALNTGLQNASSPLIARQDGDDFWYPEKLQKQVNLLESNKEIDICGTQIRLMNPDGSVKDDSFRYPTEDIPMKSWLLTGRNSLAHPSVVFRKSILLRTGGYDDTYPIAEDHHLWLRCIKWFNFCNIDEVLLDYNSDHNPKYDPMYPKLASESQFRALQHMGVIGVRKD